MKALVIDPAARIARVPGGRHLRRPGRARPRPRLRSPPGDTASVGMGGLTTGGGIGLHGPQARPHDRQPALGRGRHGRRRDRNRPACYEHPDLFWAIRGGGGNVGVVTEFTYRLAPVEQTSSAGRLILPASPGGPARATSTTRRRPPRSSRPSPTSCTRRRCPSSPRRRLASRCS
jgi:FAD/FMN-containing dehydrogenase